MDALKEWGWAAALAINLLMGWVLWSLRAGFVARAEFDALRQQVALVEVEVKHLPTADDLSDLRQDVAKLQGQVDATAKVLAGVSAAVTRIENYLMKSPV